MAKRIPYWVYVVALCCCVSFTTKQHAAGNNKPASLLILRVTVYDQYSNRINNAHVHLTHALSSRSWVLNTDMKGRAHMPVDNHTGYSAIAEKKGFLNSMTLVFQTDSSTPVDTLPVMLVLREMVHH